MEAFSYGFLTAGIIVFGLSICAIVAGSQGMQSKVYHRKGPMTSPPDLFKMMGRKVPIPPPPRGRRLVGEKGPELYRPTGSHETYPFAGEAWMCHYCDRMNEDKDSCCRGCGHSR